MIVKQSLMLFSSIDKNSANMMCIVSIHWILFSYLCFWSTSPDLNIKFIIDSTFSLLFLKCHFICNGKSLCREGINFIFKGFQLFVYESKERVVTNIRKFHVSAQRAFISFFSIICLQTLFNPYIIDKKCKRHDLGSTVLLCVTGRSRF